MQHHNLVCIFLKRLLSHNNQSVHMPSPFFCFYKFYVYFYTFFQLYHWRVNLFCSLFFLCIYLTEAAVIVAVTLQVKWQTDSSEIALPLCKHLLGEHKGTVHSIYLFPESQNIFCMIAPFPAGLRTESPKAAPITMLVGW